MTEDIGRYFDFKWHQTCGVMDSDSSSLTTMNYFLTTREKYINGCFRQIRGLLRSDYAYRARDVHQT